MVITCSLVQFTLNQRKNHSSFLAKMAEFQGCTCLSSVLYVPSWPLQEAYFFHISLSLSYDHCFPVLFCQNSFIAATQIVDCTDYLCLLVHLCKENRCTSSYNAVDSTAHNDRKQWVQLLLFVLSVSGVYCTVTRFSSFSTDINA